MPPGSGFVWPRAALVLRTALALVGLLLFGILLSSIVHAGKLPAIGLALIGAFVLLAALRPDPALMLLAALVPVATWIGRWWNYLVPWPEVVAIAFLAGYCLRAAFIDRRLERDALTIPLYTMGALVAGSLCVQLALMYQRLGSEAFIGSLEQLAFRSYFLDRNLPVDTAMRLLESLLLLRAAATRAGRDARFVPRLAHWFTVGAAAASAVNLWRLGASALRTSEPLATFGRYLVTLRFNEHYGDVNAAGSQFALSLCVALGVWASSRRLAWGLPVVLVGLALLVTGSRSAFVAVVLALIFSALFALRRFEPRRLLAIGVASALVLAVGAAASLAALPERINRARASTALQIRIEMAATSLRMLATQPVFGVGVGQFVENSGRFSSETLLTVFPAARRENAHNNVLQILAELGIAGFAAFVWILALVTLGAARLLRSRPDDPLLVGTVAGLLAFVITWMSGHPLLIDEPAFLFWVLAGGVAGWGAASAPVADSRAAGRLALIVILLGTAASVPVRAHRLMMAADLEHVGINLTGWRKDPGGVQYRIAGTESAVFVPADAAAVVIPLRAAPPHSFVQVELRLRDRPADIVRVPGDRWLEYLLALPAGTSGQRFLRLDMLVTEPSSADEGVLMIGRVEPR